MTGTLLTKTMRSGKKILYIQLSYKDPTSGKWKAKHVSTGLIPKGNKKKATEMIPSIIERYSYLEQIHENVDETFDPEISLCDYLDIWLQGKKNEIDEVTELLSFLSEKYPRLMPVSFVAAYYGLRRSELLGLTWNAIDF